MLFWSPALVKHLAQGKLENRKCLCILFYGEEVRGLFEIVFCELVLSGGQSGTLWQVTIPQSPSKSVADAFRLGGSLHLKGFLPPSLKEFEQESNPGEYRNKLAFID